MELKRFVVDHLGLSFQILLWLLENSNVDKIDVFDDSLYMNIALPLEWFNEDFLSVKIIKNEKYTLCFYNQEKKD